MYKVFERCSFVVLWSIGVGAGTFLRVRRIFAIKIFAQRMSPSLPEKTLGHSLCEYFLMKIVFPMISKQRATCYFVLHFFHIKPHWAPFLIVFSVSLPRFSEILRRSSQIKLRFPRILPGFSRNFTVFVSKPKLFGNLLYLLHPSFLHQSCEGCVHGELKISLIESRKL